MRLSCQGPALDVPESKLPVLNQFEPFRHDWSRLPEMVHLKS